MITSEWLKELCNKTIYQTYCSSVQEYVNIFTIKFADSRLDCLHVKHLVY